MGHSKKGFIALLAGLGLICAGCGTKIGKANEAIAPIAMVKRAEDSSSVAPAPQEGNTTAIAPIKWTDENNNGIADEIEKEWTNTTFYQVFGISLAALISFAISAAGTIVIIIRNNSNNKTNRNVIKDSVNTVTIFKDENISLQNKVGKLSADIETLVSNDRKNQEVIREQSRKIDELTKECEKYLSVREDTSRTLNAILDNQAAIAKSSPEQMMDGTADEIIQRSRTSRYIDTEYNEYAPDMEREVENAKKAKEAKLKRD